MFGFVRSVDKLFPKKTPRRVVAMGIPRPWEVDESAKRARRTSPPRARGGRAVLRRTPVDPGSEPGLGRPPPITAEVEWTFLEPSSSGDLAVDLPAIFLDSLRTGAGGPDDSGRLSSVRRVLQEAERVMGRPVESQRTRGARRGRGGREGQGNMPGPGSSGARGQARALASLAEWSNSRAISTSEAAEAPQMPDPTVPRFASMPEEVRSMCSTAVTRILNLMRAVERRAMEGLALDEERHRTHLIVEIMLGLRSGFAEAASDTVNGRAGWHVGGLNREEMESILLNLHYDNPEWRRNDEPDTILQKLHSCIEDGDLVEMMQLIPRMRHPIYHRDVAGETALHVACLHGREEETQILLDMGHYADPCCLDGSTPLADAASGGFANIVALLAMRTPHCVNMVDVDGDGPLHNAARGDHPDVVRVLLEAGAEITVMNSDGERPIDLAVENSRCHRLLSSRLASVDGRDREVLRLFSLYSVHDTDNEGFTIVDLISLSNGRLGPGHVVGAVHRLMALGILEVRGIGDTHWALVEAAALAERGLTYE